MATGPSSSSSWCKTWRPSWGSVLIRKRNADTFEDDVQQMLRARLTFEEAIAAGDFSLISKQRLQIVRRELFEQLDGLGL